MVRTVFMGTPDFAVPSLRALCQTQRVVGVFTQPDRPSGRGRRLAFAPVKQEALARALPIFQPKSLRPAAVMDELRALQPELIVVAAYGLILPQAVLDIPARGCINVHASLLPQYRGASPIASAILAGERETGITLMLMDAGLDTGSIIAQHAVAIADDDTMGALAAKLSALGADLLVETLPHWIAGDITPQPQDHARATLTRLMQKHDGLLDWSQSATAIARKVRAFTPWPGAFTIWRGQPLKILRAVASDVNAASGHVFQHDGALLIGAGAGSLHIVQIQMAGKRALSADEFVRGHRDFVGAQMGD